MKQALVCIGIAMNEKFHEKKTKKTRPKWEWKSMQSESNPHSIQWKRHTHNKRADPVVHQPLLWAKRLWRYHLSSGGMQNGSNFSRHFSSRNRCNWSRFDAVARVTVVDTIKIRIQWYVKRRQGSRGRGEMVLWMEKCNKARAKTSEPRFEDAHRISVSINVDVQYINGTAIKFRTIRRVDHGYGCIVRETNADQKTAPKSTSGKDFKSAQIWTQDGPTTPNLTVCNDLEQHWKDSEWLNEQQGE